MQVQWRSFHVFLMLQSDTFPRSHLSTPAWCARGPPGLWFHEHLWRYNLWWMVILTVLEGIHFKSNPQSWYWQALDDRWTGALPFCWGYQLHLSGTRTFYLPIMLAQLQFCKTHGQSSLKGFHVELSIAIGGHKSLLTNTLPQQYNPRGHRIRYWIQVPHAQLALPLLKLASWLVIPWTAHSGQS